MPSSLSASIQRISHPNKVRGRSFEITINGHWYQHFTWNQHPIAYGLHYCAIRCSILLFLVDDTASSIRKLSLNEPEKSVSKPPSSRSSHRALPTTHGGSPQSNSTKLRAPKHDELKPFNPFPKPSHSLLTAQKAKQGIKLGLYKPQDAINFMDPTQRREFIVSEKRSYTNRLVRSNNTQWWCRHHKLSHYLPLDRPVSVWLGTSLQSQEQWSVDYLMPKSFYNVLFSLESVIMISLLSNTLCCQGDRRLFRSVDVKISSHCNSVSVLYQYFLTGSDFRVSLHSSV